MEQQQPPPGVLLVGIDGTQGLYVWLRSHETVAPHTFRQHPGYSRALTVDVANPPDFLGEPVFFPKAEIEGWEEIVSEQTQTNKLNREIRKLFGVAG